MIKLNQRSKMKWCDLLALPMALTTSLYSLVEETKTSYMSVPDACTLRRLDYICMYLLPPFPPVGPYMFDAEFP